MQPLHTGAQLDSDRLNRWLTLGANVGVLVGLFLLIIEIGQNTEMMRAQMVQSRADNLVQLYEGQMHSEFWPAIRAKQRNSANYAEWLDSLDAEEYERVQFLYFREVNDIRSQYYMYVEGLLPQEIWEVSTRGQILRVMRLRDALKWGCDPDTTINRVMNQIAREGGAPECGSHNSQNYFGGARPGN